jgi:hypothetical protein
MKKMPKIKEMYMYVNEIDQSKVFEFEEDALASERESALEIILSYGNVGTFSGAIENPTGAGGRCLRKALMILNTWCAEVDSIRRQEIAHSEKISNG